MVLPSDARAVARKFALQNAVHHGGQAEAKALLGKILGQRADLRPHARDFGQLLSEVVAAVNALDPEAQRAELSTLAPEMVERRVVEQRVGLKRLPRDETGTIVMRFAPNPNGPATLGHSRGMVLHAEYQRMYRDLGRSFKMILRFDDTDPATKKPVLEAYQSLEEDFRWLGGTPDAIVYASDRIPEYYAHAERLVRAGHAYVCECAQETFKALKDRGEPCPHRSQSADANHAAWQRMLEGTYAPGAAVLRIPTDIKHPDPALRDWVAFRILDEPHPRVGNRYRVWPLLDFQSAIEDRLQSVTHILRGKDLIDSERKQAYVYGYFGWTYPTTAHWGRVKIHEFGKVSKSLLAEGIRSGKFRGWDDVRLPTLAAMRRRGIRPDALRNFWVGLGLTEKDVAASMENVEAENRKLVEPESNRYFFVADPAAWALAGLPAAGLESRAPRHPDHLDRGHRVTRVAASSAGVLLDGADSVSLRKDEVFRLKDLGNFRVLQAGRAEYAGNDLKILKQGARILHWVHDASEANLPAEVWMPDENGTTRVGRAEAAVASEVGRVVQFERFGFVRVEARDGRGVRAVFTHA